MVYETEIKGLKLFKRGKVRDLYELGNRLIIIATDRISCFDLVLPTPIPGKGKILTQISLFWFSFLKEITGSHLLSAEMKDLPAFLEKDRGLLAGRIMLVKRCAVVPFECVVRGYLSGSAWKEYKQKGTICGMAAPAGLKEADKLPEPLFTPAEKAESGHDQNIDFSYLENKIGKSPAKEIKELSIAIYQKAAEFAREKGIIIADTKFEFGMDKNRLILVDEALTPDSSRFWPMDAYAPGRPQVSFDKQFVRDYLEKINWDKNPPAPALPEDVVRKTVDKYRQALERLTGITA